LILQWKRRPEKPVRPGKLGHHPAGPSGFLATTHSKICIALAGVESGSARGLSFVRNNDALTTLNGIGNMDFSMLKNIELTESAALAGCAQPNICAYLEGGGASQISGNEVGCNSAAEVLAACSSPLTALLGGGGDICLGESLDLTIFFTGAAPFTFALAENGVPQPPVTTSNNPHTVSVEPVSGTVFTLVSVSNAQGSGLAGGSASVSVFSAAPGGDCCTGHDLPRRHHFADSLRRHGISMEHGPTNRPNRGATRRYDDVRRDRFRCVCLHRHRDLDGCGGGIVRVGRFRLRRV
jgi:hypothetical protein